MHGTGSRCRCSATRPRRRCGTSSPAAARALPDPCGAIVTLLFQLGPVSSGHVRGQSLCGEKVTKLAHVLSGHVLVEREEPIAVVRLNRPKQLNALSGELMDELVAALQELDEDEAIRC